MEYTGRANAHGFGALILKIKVIPKGGRTGFAGAMDDGTQKIRVNAPPEKGKANDELRAFLARHYGVPKANVTIVSGESSPHKQVRIDGVE